EHPLIGKACAEDEAGQVPTAALYERHAPTDWSGRRHASAAAIGGETAR
ncbi:hypothetical protein F442_03389, partial [Phytophthora nicotianae P10297]